MKIGVVTYWSSDDNYGQQLQCFALQKFLCLKGHDVYLIKYSPEKEEKTFIEKLIGKISLKKFWNVVNGKRKKDRLWKANEAFLQNENAQRNVVRKFIEFRSECIKSTDVVYRSIDELRNNPPEADIYICGSDQVWNNSLLEKNTAGWFLDFGSARRVAYAASVGRVISKKELSIFKSYLKKFAFISVREKNIESLCHSLGFPNVCVTLDPTLLLNKEHYRSLYRKSINEDNGQNSSYVFVYALNILTAEELAWSSMQEYLNSKSLKVKFVCSSGYYQARKLIDSVNPELLTVPEWIAGIENAESVVTTSFHGIVFSIIMKKKFIAIPLKNQYSAGNARIESLLKTLGLEERIYREKLSFEKQMNKPINWDDVESKFSILKNSSEQFLLNAISNC